MYNLPFFHSTVRLIDDIKRYNKLNRLRRELDRLSLQKYVLDQAFSDQTQSLIALANISEAAKSRINRTANNILGKL